MHQPNVRLFVLTLILAVSLLKAEPTPPALSYLASRDHGNGLKIEGAVQVTPEGYLHFDGNDGGATFPGSGKYNITPNGFGLLMTCRLPATLNDSALVGIVNKLNSFRSNRFRARGLYVTFTPEKDGKVDEDGEVCLNAGRKLPFGEWLHFAFTAEFVNEREQGRVGYFFRYFINGELMVEQFAPRFEPYQSNADIAIGFPNNGSGSFQGDISGVEIFDRFVPEAEIMDKIKADSRLRLFTPPGYRQANAEVLNLTAQIRAAVVGYQAWLVSALERAEMMDGDTPAILSALNAANACFQGDKAPEDFATTFNANQDGFRLVVNGQAIILLARKGGTTNPPIVDIFNRATQSAVLAGRSFAWRLKVGDKEICDHTPGLTYRIQDFTKTADGASFTVAWRLDDLDVIGKFRLEGVRLTANLSATSPSAPITEYSFPKMTLNHLPGKDDTLVAAFRSGTLYRNFSSGGNVFGIYPSANMTLPFIGYYDEQENGVYLGWEDPSCCRKEIEMSGKQGRAEISFSSNVGVRNFTEGNFFAMPGEAVLEFYHGDWFTAGQIYKRFLQTKADWYPQHPRLDTPLWYRDGILILLGSKNEPNYPYLREYLDLPFIINGGRKPDNIKELWEKGIHLKTYTNIRLWKYNPSISDTSPKEDFDRYHDEQNSPVTLANCVRQLDGNIAHEFYNNIPWNIGCPEADGIKAILHERVMGYARGGSWHGIYHDQLCSSPILCYNPNHGHLLGDPCSWIRGYRQFLTWFAARRQKYPLMSQDGEDFCEAYARWTDGFMTWRFVQQNQVPLAQSLYSGGRVQFTGRTFNLDVAGDDQAWICKLVSQFVYGEQMGWFHTKDIYPANYRRVLVKKLCHLRLELLGYFNDSDMLPFLKFQQTMPVISSLWGGLRSGAKYVETPQVMHSVWQRSDGNCLAVFVNASSEPIRLTPKLPLTGKLSICREGATEPELTDNAIPHDINLSPYGTEIWFIGNDNTTPAQLAKKMAQFPKYTPGKELTDGQ